MKRCYCYSLFSIFILFSTYSYTQENLIFNINGVSFNMIFVEGSSFTMGCTAEQGNCNIDERPAHKVTLTDYYMGEFVVTQQLWKAVMGTTVQHHWLLNATSEREDLALLKKRFKNMDAGSNFNINVTFDVITELGQVVFRAEDHEKVNTKGIGNSFPMYYINYRDCELFCEVLNYYLAEQLPDGYRFRLPTEAQWEYAARGGIMSREYRYSGSDIMNEVAWNKDNSEETSHEVGKKIKNELGLYDMSGNVWEWCRDNYSENYYSSSPSLNPKGPDKGNQYVLRGGSWEDNEKYCRTAKRYKDAPDVCKSNYGFRIILGPPAKLTGSGFFGYTGNFTPSRLSSGKNLTFKVNDQKLEMIFVEGGVFSMGCLSNDMNCSNIEKPVRNVKLSNYYLGKFEITQKLWDLVMGTTPRQQRDSANIHWGIYGESDNHPIYYVSYEECEIFCERLNRLLYVQLPEDFLFKLPTEAQWEYAARGGNKSKHFLFSGSNKIGQVAWWEENNGKEVSKVGLKQKNELGLYDMSGNVWEWCRDWFESDYYSYGSDTNPQGPLLGTQRVLRGGSWNLPAWQSRVTNRYYYEPTARAANVGFRVALEPAKKIFDLKSLKDAINPVKKIISVNNLNFKINDLNFEMVFVEGGTFTMGCTSNPNDCFTNEEPTHSITLSDYYIGKFQVTQQMWNKVMGYTLIQQRDLVDTSLALYGEGTHYPMYYINYVECEEFCNNLNKMLSNQLPKGYKFSLPTEAQWEYAARGGKRSKGYPYSGDNTIEKVAWFEENNNESNYDIQWEYAFRGIKKNRGSSLLNENSNTKMAWREESTMEQTHEVGLKKGNELGIYDMSGNLWEWCLDWFDGNYYYYSPLNNPIGPGYGFQRVLRGGSWRSIAQGCRVSCRFANSPNERASNCGFRLALVKENTVR